MFGPGTQRSATMPQNLPSEQERGYGSHEQWVEPGAAPGYYDVSSPTYAPPRPSTAGGSRQKTPQTQVPLPQMPPQPQQQHTTQNNSLPPQEDVDDFCDDYYGESEPQRPLTTVIDMPDFDAIPQSNNNHRRGDSIENHLSPATQLGPSYGLTQSVSATDAHSSQFDAQYQAPQSRSQPEFHASNVHEMPGDTPPVPVLPRANTGFENQHGLPNGQRGRGVPSRGMTTDGTYRGPLNQAYGRGQPTNFGAQYSRQPPPVQRGYSGESTFSEPPLNTMRNGPSPMNSGVAIPRPGTAGPAPQRIPSDPMGRRPGTSQSHSNLDALPAHPAPFRPGLMQPGQQQQPQAQPAQVARPPPVRQYNSETTRPSSESQQSGIQRQSAALHPVTHDELNRLRNTWKSNPSDSATGLLLAKKLVEAASVLSDEGGTADTRTRNKNREKFILEGHKTIKKLVAAGYGDAMFYLADCYGQGLLGLQVDTKQAFLLYQSGAKAGHPASAYRTAVCCEMGHEEGGGTKREPEKAVQWYRRAAALGDTPALYKMGMILLKGLLGQQRNFGEAINMLKRAAERADRDNPHALHELALIYEAQTGNDRVIVDEAYSLQLFHQAADLNYKFSQFRLGQAYEYGLLGCAIDARASIAWYTRAAAQEEHQSELALSGWYLTGTQGMLEQSDTEAYLWARKAACAEPPLPKALFAMGYFTEVGIGCPRSLDEAKRWYGRAAGKCHSLDFWESQ
jgi:TPR repeat protein